MSQAPVNRPRLVVFSDDWGRHRSSAQFLAEELLARYDIEWIETVGTRRPSTSLADTRRGLQKLAQWLRPPSLRGAERGRAHPRLTIHAPLMWPSFQSRAGRNANAAVLGRTLRSILGKGPKPSAILTTVPLVADVVMSNPDQHWIYYCVDALHDWEQLDRGTLQAMERDLVPRCARVVAASQDLAQKVGALGPTREVLVVPHGVDYERWNKAQPAGRAGLGRPMALFFGAVDERIDPSLCESIAASAQLVLVGPHSRAPRTLRRCANVELWGPRPHEELPGLAAAADVLVLPYRSDQTTAHLIPLKLKEYLSTVKPVVANHLPAASSWAAALDIATDHADFAQLVATRAATGPLEEQLRAREQLKGESWGAMARQMESCFAPQPETTALTTVLHVRSCAGPGSGPEKTLLRSHLHGDPSRYRPIVALLCDPEDREVDAVFAEAQRLGATFHRVDDRGPFDRKVLGELLRIARQENVAIWHGHDAKSNVLGLRARRRMALLFVSTAHGWVHRTRRTPLYDRLDRWTLRRADGVISVSRDIEDQLSLGRRTGVLGRVIPNGVEAPELPEVRRRAAGDPAVLGAVGRLEPEKGIDDLLQALALLQASGSDLRLLIYGTGSLRPELLRTARRLGVEDRVELRGFEANRSLIFSSMDLFVLPSLREGTPNSLLEAMAHGLATVATPVGGVPELVENGREALLVPPRDPSALAAAIDRLLSDPDMAHAMGAAARATAVDRHGFAARMERVWTFYDELLKRAAP